MRLVILIVVATALIALTRADKSTSDLPPLKIDKNLRQALLKALEDLETESAEQKDPPTAEGLLKKLQEEPIEPEESTTVSSEDRFKDASITFEKFPGDCEIGPSEEKLQNSSFETERVIVSDFTISADSETPKLEKVIFQKYNILLNDQASNEKITEPVEIEKVESRSVKGGILSNIIDDTPKTKSSNQEKENLDISSSNGIAAASANALVSPSPTAASPTDRISTKNTSTPLLSTVTTSTNEKEKDKSEVNIFQAPLIAAFTVQQDEKGNAKSVVPLFKSNSNGEALSLQEQLDFKQKLLQKQLAELQEQQYQQTQFLLRQHQLYQEQQRQKQQFYLQEQARLKLLEEQKNQLNQQQSFQSQVLQQQQQQQQLTLQQQHKQQQLSLQQQLPLQPQALPLQQQQLSLQQQVSLQQQQLPSHQPLGAFSHHNPLSLQLPAKTPNVQFQPSVGFQLPSAVVPPSFQHNQLERFRVPQVSHQSILLQNQPLPRLQPIQQEQRFQQSFASLPSDFQLPVATGSTRFNRQEAHGSVGNFGINDNRHLSRNNGFLELPRIPAQPFVTFNQFSSFRPQPSRPSTANQIQHLLYQSGAAGDLGKGQGNGNPEDLNIVSKVLALNVGALPTKSHKYNQDFFGRA